MLTKHSSSSYLPEKHLLAKRLAQCLTSSLPSGVHLKALETYRLVFTRIGPARLAADLPLYAGGLFPLFSYSATSLKPALLSLYESTIVPLGSPLVPLLDGFVLAILPGLEDESSEFFDRSVALLDALVDSVNDPRAFCRSLWRTLLLSPPMRLPAVGYLRTRATGDKKPKWTHHLFDDVPLVSYAISAALGDKNALVQRNVLDLLLSTLALDLPFFCDNSKSPQQPAVALVNGVMGALLRRDLSLTKRVHSWFLGSRDRNRGVQYCDRFSRNHILSAFDSEINRAIEHNTRNPETSSVLTRPCKIISSLIDRQELFESLSASVALRVLRYARAVLQQPRPNVQRDIEHALSDIIAQLGSVTIFRELERHMTEDYSAGEEFASFEREKYELLSFALLFAAGKDEQVRAEQLPNLLHAAVEALGKLADYSGALKTAVSFCASAFGVIHVSTLPTEAHNSVRKVMPEVAASFSSFFVGWLASAVAAAPVEMRRAYADISIEEEVAAEFQTASVREPNDETVTVAKAACSFLTMLVSAHICSADTTVEALQATAKCAASGDTRIALAGARAYAEIAAFASAEDCRHVPDEQTLGVLRKAWRLLHPSLSTATAPNAQVWLLLQRQFPDLVDVVVADGVLASELPRRLRNLERFACVWRLSVEHRLSPKPADAGLFLMLDALDDHKWGPKMLARTWLAEALTMDASVVVDAPLRLLLTKEASTVSPDHTFAGVYDAPRALYAFQVLRSIVEGSMLESSSSPMSGSMSMSNATTPMSDPELGNASSKSYSMSTYALATSAPSAKTAAALAATFKTGKLDASFRLSDSHGPTSGESQSAPSNTKEGPVRLLGMFPAVDYATVMVVTTLGYLRGKIPPEFDSPKPAKPSPSPDDSTPRDFLSPEDEKDAADYEGEWLSAGLGYVPFMRLHREVQVAAAECLATLAFALPMPAGGTLRLVAKMCDPLLHLLGTSITTHDTVLQLHYLDALEGMVSIEGAVPSVSIGNADNGVDAAMAAVERFDPDLPQAEGDHVFRTGVLEAHEAFLPWAMVGLSQACKPPSDGRDVGSQEIDGLRRRWMRFVCVVMRNVGTTGPQVVEAIVLVLCRLLQDRQLLIDTGVSTHVFSSPDSEFSRIDERLILLEGMARVLNFVVSVFEDALRQGSLEDSRISLPAGHKESTSATQGGGSGNVGALRGASDSEEKPAAQSPAVESQVRSSSGLATKFTHTAEGGTSAPRARPQSVQGTESSLAAPMMASGAGAMMTAMNPLRMINDFVKDVFTGTGSNSQDGPHDPRRDAARSVFAHLPAIVRAIVQTWGPATEGTAAPDSHQLEAGNEMHTTIARPPLASRLSHELPRERRKAQRRAVLAVAEPLFGHRPIDVLAAIVTLFREPTEEEPAEQVQRHQSAASMAVDMLHALEQASPEVLCSTAAELYVLALRWDAESAIAMDGQKGLQRRSDARAVFDRVVDASPEEAFATLVDQAPAPPQNYGPAFGGSAIAADSSSSSSAIQLFLSGRQRGPGMFHPGDYFTETSPWQVQRGTLELLERFFDTTPSESAIIWAWPAVYAIAKDVLVSTKRNEASGPLLRVLAAFARRCPTPLPDKRYRKELMQIAASAVATCSTTACGASDTSGEDIANGRLGKNDQVRLGCLEALSSSIQVVIESAFVEDRPQAVTTVSAAVGAAVSNLQRTASRAAAVQGATRDWRHKAKGKVGASTTGSDESISQFAAASASLLLSVSRHEWGIKTVRKEIVALIDDASFFQGKRGEAMTRIAAVVREVIAAGGAQALFTSVGSTVPVAATGIPGLFTGRDSESVVRARAVRRVAFCVFVSEPDHFHAQLPGVLERLRDSLRLADPVLVCECFLCLRVLLLCTGPSSIAAFRATSLSEIFRIASDATKDLSETLAALRYLDLVTLLSPPDFGYERCFFFSSEDSNSNAGDVNDGHTVAASPPYRPLVQEIARLAETGTGDAVTKDASSSTPLVLEAGRTVLRGAPPNPLTVRFIGEYAAMLCQRNQSAELATAVPDVDSIRIELAREFEQ